MGLSGSQVPNRDRCKLLLERIGLENWALGTTKVRTMDGEIKLGWRWMESGEIEVTDEGG